MRRRPVALLAFLLAALIAVPAAAARPAASADYLTVADQLGMPERSPISGKLCVPPRAEAYEHAEQFGAVRPVSFTTMQDPSHRDGVWSAHLSWTNPDDNREYVWWIEQAVWHVPLGCSVDPDMWAYATTMWCERYNPEHTSVTDTYCNFEADPTHLQRKPGSPTGGGGITTFGAEDFHVTFKKLTNFIGNARGPISFGYSVRSRNLGMRVRWLDPFHNWESLYLSGGYEGCSKWVDTDNHANEYLPLACLLQRVF